MQTAHSSSPCQPLSHGKDSQAHLTLTPHCPRAKPCCPLGVLPHPHRPATFPCSFGSPGLCMDCVPFPECPSSINFSAWGTVRGLNLPQSHLSHEACQFPPLTPSS